MFRLYLSNHGFEKIRLSVPERELLYEKMQIFFPKISNYFSLESVLKREISYFEEIKEEDLGMFLDIPVCKALKAFFWLNDCEISPDLQKIDLWLDNRYKLGSHVYLNFRGGFTKENLQSKKSSMFRKIEVLYKISNKQVSLVEFCLEHSQFKFKNLHVEGYYVELPDYKFDFRENAVMPIDHFSKCPLANFSHLTSPFVIT